MKRSRLKDPRLLRRDLAGDAILTLLAGAVLLAGVFLPWANADVSGWVNYSAAQSGGINGVLDTRWGWPELALVAATIAAGVVILLRRPGRASVALGLVVAVLGAAVFGVAQDAAAHIGYRDPGLGMYLTTLAGILLVPIGLATALVAWLYLRAVSAPTAPPAARPTATPTAPPAPGSAPPS